MALVPVDQQSDAPLRAIAALVRGAVAAELGEGMIAALYSDPRSLQVLSAKSLPALCLFRKSRKSRQESSTSRVVDIVVGIHYLLPASDPEQRELRWPALDAVFDVIEQVVIDGKHASVQGGAEVLLAAGVQAQRDTAKAQNALAQGGEEYPMLIGEITITYSPAEVVASDLDDFLEFYAAFDDYPNPDPDTDDDEPLTSDEVTIPQD